MPRATADQIITQGHLRYFYQRNGASPYNLNLYGGQDGQFLNIESTTNPQTGGISAVSIQNPKKRKSYTRVAREESPPDLVTATVSFLQDKGGIPRQLYNLRDCITTFYQTSGDCEDPSDFLHGWSDYIKVWSFGETATTDEGGGAFDADSMVQDGLDYTFSKTYTTGAISFGEKGTTAVTQEVIDVTYGNRAQCGGCGPDDDGTQLQYALTDGVSGSAGSLPTIYWTADNWATVNTSPVTNSLATDTAISVDIVGQRIMVTISNATGGGYHLADINRLTGAPGSWSALINSGFVTGSEPNDVYVANPREVYFCGDSGYIYKSTAVLQGVSVLDAGNATANNLNRIDGYEKTILCVGDSATVIFSENSGATWATTTNAPGAGNLTAVEVLGEFLWWAGDNAGGAYYTNVQGESAWVSLTLPTTAAGTVTNISDINFATDEMGYILGNTADPTAVIFSTMDGGRTWDRASGSDSNNGRITGSIVTADRFNRIAYPTVDNFSVASSNVLIGGLAGDGSDGIILLGTCEIKG